MLITRVYADEKGNSCFGEIQLPLKEAFPMMFLSRAFKVKEIIFREVSANWHIDWHCAPRKQFILYLSGGTVEITVSNGDKKLFTPGSILLVEDTKGHGHISRVIDQKPVQSVTVVLEE